jgi:RimJ/RimL family protein N-acetyltransferase
MAERPILITSRLVLRPFQSSDAREVHKLAGEYEIAANTLLIPHPYQRRMAEDWIGGQQEFYDQGKGVIWAITARENGELRGAIGLTLDAEHHKAELGYWIGKPYWSKGYATEAAGAVMQYGFEVLNLNRIFARHLGRNPASGRVMQKLGMQLEGCLRQDAHKWEVFEDVFSYGILHSEYEHIATRKSLD